MSATNRGGIVDWLATLPFWVLALVVSGAGVALGLGVYVAASYWDHDMGLEWVVLRMLTVVP